MNVESEALRVVLDDETVVTLPKQVSPMLASLEGLFEGEAFSVPSASGITKVGCSNRLKPPHTAVQKITVVEPFLGPW